MEIKKLFSASGIAGLKEVTFKNLSDKGTGVNIIYFTNSTDIDYRDNTPCGINFLLSKPIQKSKTLFSTFIIPPNFAFYNHRISVLKYSKYFKSKFAKGGFTGRVLKSIPLSKTELLQKNNFYDLSVMAEAFKRVSNTSELKAIQELFNTFEKISNEFSKTFYKKDTYVVIETNYDNKEILNLFLKQNRIKNCLIPDVSQKGIKGILVKTKNFFYPLTLIDEKDNLRINMQSFGNILKGIENEHNEDLKKLGILSQENENLASLTTSYTKELKKTNSEISEKKITKDKTIDEKVIEKLESIKELDTVIKDKKTEVKINSILNDTNELITRDSFKERTEKEDYLKNIETDPKFKKYQDQVKKLKELNFKFNGSIQIQKANLPKNLYFDPIKVTGIETFTSYNKQKTEFDEVLDESMFDLFKSLEIDTNAGLKVQNVKISFEDNIKNRYKIYKVRLKNTKFGYEKPYDIELRVPYPVQGKYLKLDSNKYIMVNQFFPYPILKIQPNTVRIYTHYSTAAVELKGSVVNLGSNDLNRIKDNFLISLTEAKKKVKVSELTNDKKQEIKDKYNLPLMLNDKLMVNLEIQ